MSDRLSYIETMQPEPHTEGKNDKWLILALRILEMVDRTDVAKELEDEFERLRACFILAVTLGKQADRVKWNPSGYWIDGELRGKSLAEAIEAIIGAEQLAEECKK